METVITSVEKTQSFTKILEKYQRHPAYRNFINSIRSTATRTVYSVALSKYLNLEINKNLTLDEILSKNVKTIESEIIEEIIRQQEDEKLSSSSTNLFLSSITHFFAINDVVINRKKIKKFIADQTTKTEYRSYTTDEISRILSLSNDRDRVIVLLLASTGMRVGALPDIKLKHLKRWIVDNHKGTPVYQIEVYASSTKSRYSTFCTPEAAKAIDEYLDLRKRCGENLKQDPNTGDWINSDTFLIIKQFDKTTFIHSTAPIKSHAITTKVMIPKLHQLGIRKKIPMTEINLNNLNPTKTKIKAATIRHELHPCHSLRIFAVTQMQRSKVDKTIREMLVGHSTGLDKVYYKPQHDEILQEYLKAVDLLTINNEHRLQKQVDFYKQRENDLSHMTKELAVIKERLGI